MEILLTAAIGPKFGLKVWISHILYAVLSQTMENPFKPPITQTFPERQKPLLNSIPPKP